MAPENRKRRKVKSGIDTSSWSQEERDVHDREKKMATPIAEMELPVRVVNALEDNNVLLASDLMKQTYETLMQMKNFGYKTLEEVKVALKVLGLEPPNWSKPPKEAKQPRSKGSGRFAMKFW